MNTWNNRSVHTPPVETPVPYGHPDTHRESGALTTTDRKPRWEQPGGRQGRIAAHSQVEATPQGNAHEVTTCSSNDDSHTQTHEYMRDSMLPSLEQAKQNCGFRDARMGVTRLPTKTLTVAKSEGPFPARQSFFTGGMLRAHIRPPGICGSVWRSI